MSRVNVGRTLNTTFQLPFANFSFYAKQLWPFVALYAGAGLIGGLLTYNVDEGDVGAALAGVGIALVASIAGWIAYLLGSLVAIALSYGLLHGQHLSFEQSWGRVKERWPSAFGAMFITFLVTMALILPLFGIIGIAGVSALLGTPDTASGFEALGMLILGLFVGMLVILPVLVYLGLRWSLIMPVAVVESLGAVDTIKRSWNLTRGNLLSIFAAFFVIMLVAFIGSIAMSVVLVPLVLVAGNSAALPVVSALLQFGFMLVIAPVSAMMIASIYHQLTGAPSAPPAGVGAPPEPGAGDSAFSPPPPNGGS